MKIQNTAAMAKVPVNALIYGPAGAGKTTLASTTGNKTLVISAEGGLLSLRGQDIDYVEVRSMDEIKEAYAYVRDNEAGYQTVFIDSVSEIAEVVLTYEKAQVADPRQAYGKLLEQVVGLMRAFRDLPVNCIFIAKQDRVRDDLTGMMLYGPSMPGTKLGPSLPYLCDIVGAMRIVEADDGKPMRVIQVVGDQQYDCKDRTGRLPPVCEPNLAQIFNLINKD